MIDSNSRSAAPITWLMKTTALVALVFVGGCTKQVNTCMSDADCMNPAYPFCDVNGEFAASGGDKNVCTIVPPECPVERCGCTPGTATCVMSMLTVCNPDGMSTTATACTVGCESGSASCKTFVPSNGLAPSLAGAATMPALAIPAGATIDSTTGIVTAADGTVVHDSAASSVVLSGTTMIRVFAAPTLSLPSLKVVGTLPIAFVASDTIAVDGLVDVSADGSAAGPGAAGSAAGCNGGSVRTFPCNVACVLPGAGGAGNAIEGGAGGDPDATSIASVGVGEVGFALVGGCAGGAILNSSGVVTTYGGAGGGAIQLVAGTTITLNGVIHAGGGGGQGGTNTAGGSGGVVILEAPAVQIDAAGGIAANGGAGAGCSVKGADGTPDMVPAIGGSGSGCDVTLTGGQGGIASSTAMDIAGGQGKPAVTGGFFGGGGGSVGRARIATADGTFMQAPSSIMSVVVTSETLPTM
jgi:hypothetical protein